MTLAGPRPEEPYQIPEEPEGPPLREIGLGPWLRQNLFSTWFNGVLTIIFGAFIAYLAYRLGRFVLIDARWEVVQRNITNFMVFQFPRAELWRVWAALFVLAAAAGLGAGAAGRRRETEVLEGRGTPVAGRGLVFRRVAPLVALVVVLLVAARSLTATVLTFGVAATAVAFRLLGRRLPPRAFRLVVLAVLGGIVAAFLVIVAFGGVPFDRWGGLMLTVFLAVAGIVISFPLGVLLALGRRSKLPAVKLVCVVYIELIRGVPLITILFMAVFALGFFLPAGSDPPSTVARALVGLILFTAAYVAEIVRGGLQGVPRGQIEAAQALGLSPTKTTRLILLPQALRSVIPALVGQFISLFKDTSLVFVVGLTELLAVAEIVTQQPDFRAQGLIVETLLFAAFIYWAGSYWMSRESQRLEQRLGVGIR
jgi:general L-amino acid transport system permease protein